MKIKNPLNHNETKIKELLVKDKYPIEDISEKILNFKCNNKANVKYAHRYFTPTKAIEIETDNKVYLINLEQNEFAALTIFTFDENNNLITEIGYDEQLNKLYFIKM